MTREEILSIEEYCAEHKVSHRKHLEELESTHITEVVPGSSGYYLLLAGSTFQLQGWDSFQDLFGCLFIMFFVCKWNHHIRNNVYFFFTK